MKRAEALEVLANFLLEHENTITNAMYVYAQAMNEAGVGARAQWKAGQDDPEVKAAQDGSFITNLGLKHSAQLFDDSASRARDVARRLQAMLDRLEEG